MAVSGPEKEGVLKDIQVDHKPGGKGEGQAEVYAWSEKDRGEQHSPACHDKIPVPDHKNISAGGPDIMGGNPDPVRAHEGPVAGLPGIASIVPHPASWDPGVVRRWGIAARSDFHRFRRLRQVLRLQRIDGCPVAGDPLIPFTPAGPIAWDPPSGMTAVGRFTVSASAACAAVSGFDAIGRQIDRGSATISQSSSFSAIGGLKWNDIIVPSDTWTDQTTSTTWTTLSNPSTPWTELDEQDAA